MTFHRGTGAAFAVLVLTACGQGAPPAGVSQGAVVLAAADEPITAPNTGAGDAEIGQDGLRTRFLD